MRFFSLPIRGRRAYFSPPSTFARLQRFKLNIASSVVTQQNSDLSSIGTDVLDLFSVSASDAPASTKAAKDRPMGQKAILDNLADLPPEEECMFPPRASPFSAAVSVLMPDFPVDQDLDFSAFTASLV